MEIDLTAESTKAYTPDAEHARLARWAGTWRGVARTYLEPGGAGIEERWEGRMAPILGGRFVRFEYRSAIQGTPIAGELLVAFEEAERLWRTSWVDSFHTGTAILVSVGEARGSGISVKGSYYAGEGQPRWGWRTELDDSREGELAIRMYNILPDGNEVLGVDIQLRRA